MRADFIPPVRHRAVLLRAACAALLMAVAGNALSLTGARFVGRYDFGYAIRGDKPARPAQVFDDGGGKVYFQARPNQPMPAVFAGRDPALLVLQPEGQYFTARTSATEFTLVLGGARATVRRGDTVLGEATLTPQRDGPRLLASAEPGLVDGIDYGSPDHRSSRRVLHEQPIVFPPGSATLKPEVLEALSVLVLRIGRDIAITAAGRDDAGGNDALATLRAEALRNALLARGVPARDIRLARADDDAVQHPRASTLRWTSIEHEFDGGSSAVAVAPTPGRWSVLVQDITLERTLQRWGAQAGVRLKWDAQRNFLIGAPDTIEGTFETALKTVLDSAGIRQSDYPLEACIYANDPPLVRITRQGEQARECEAP